MAIPYARLVDATPNVANATDRDARFPTPALYQKVFRIDTDVVELWTGAAWVTAIDGGSGALLFSGTGSPEGVVTAGIGSTYQQTDGSNGIVLWVKNSGAGNTGWRLLQTSLNIINVLDRGVVGDGVTDDAPALQAILTAAVDGDVIFFPPGKTYAIGTGLTVTGKRLTLSGYGATILETAILEPMVSLVNAHGSRVEGLRFVGIETAGTYVGASAQARAGVVFETSIGVDILHVNVSGKSSGIVFDTCIQSAITNCHAVGFIPTAIADDNFSDGFIVGNGADVTVTGCSAKNFGVGFLVGDSADRIVITGCTATDCPDNCYYISSGSMCTVTGCTAIGTDGTGIKARGNGHSITGNTVENAASCGIGLSGNGGDDGTGFNGFGTTCTGNTLRACGNTSGYGIDISTQDSFNPRGFSVIGNSLFSCGSATTAVIRVLGEGHKISNNQLDTATVLYAILVSGGSGTEVNYVTITNNTLSDITGEGVRVVFVDNSQVSFNTFNNVSGNLVRLRSCDSTDVVGNRGGVGIVNWDASFQSTLGQCYGNSMAAQGDLTALTPMTAARGANAGGIQDTAADVGNANASLVVNTSPVFQKWATTLTATRTATLSTSLAYDGAWFFVMRTASGNFALSVGGLIDLWRNQWCLVVYNGSAWEVRTFGRLSMGQNWSAPTTNYTNLDGDDGLFLGGATPTLTLQSAATRTRPLLLRSVASGNWTLTAGGGDTIEGAASVPLVPGEATVLMPNGTNWLRVS